MRHDGRFDLVGNKALERTAFLDIDGTALKPLAEGVETVVIRVTLYPEGQRPRVKTLRIPAYMIAEQGGF